MPHAELKYSSDLNLDAADILAAIERTILQHDPGSGDCKGRAYPTDLFHHTHVLVDITMLTKAHRDDAFTKTLMTAIEHEVKQRIAQDCFFSFALTYSTGAYVTNTHRVSP